LARKFDAQLSLMMNVDLVPISAAVDWGSLQRELREAAQAQLRELKATLNIDAPHHVTEGFVATSVRDVAERTYSDLIVVGRGRNQGDLSRLWSNLYTIVREAPCPVLSI
jgi:nucleotide-binding universal stress UspA family protein